MISLFHPLNTLQDQIKESGLTRLGYSQFNPFIISYISIIFKSN